MTAKEKLDLIEQIKNSVFPIIEEKVNKKLILEIKKVKMDNTKTIREIKELKGDIQKLVDTNKLFINDINESQLTSSEIKTIQQRLQNLEKITGDIEEVVQIAIENILDE